MAVGAAVIFRNRLLELVHGTLKDGLAALLWRSKLAARQPPAVGPRSNAANVNGQVGQREIVVVFRTPEILFSSRAALRRYVWIGARPLVRLRVLDALKQFVVHNAAAKAIRLQVPLNAVEGGIDVAVGAANLPLKRIARGIEGLLPVAQRGDRLRSGQCNGGRHAVGARVYQADRVVKPVGHKQPAAIACQRQAARIESHGNTCNYIVCAR